MTTAASPAPPPPPSAPPALDVVKDELDRVQASCEARSNGVDTKAGLILATAGALIGFRASDPSPLDVLAALPALVAGGYAIYAFHPRPGDAVSPQVLYQAHLDQPDLDLQDQMIRGRLLVWERDEKALTAKARRLTRATTLLAVSAVLFMASSAWKVASGQPSPSPSPAPSPTTSNITPATTTTASPPATVTAASPTTIPTTRVGGPSLHTGAASIDLTRPAGTT